MGQPSRADEQALVAQLGQALSRLVAPGWRRLWAEYRAAGRQIEVDAFVAGPDGTPHWVQPSQEIAEVFGRLRTAMYRPGRGTWLSALITIEPSLPYRFDVNLDVEPRWRYVPPPMGFQDELRFFPREDRWIPAWLRQRAGMPPQTPVPAVQAPPVQAPTAQAPSVPAPEPVQPSPSPAAPAAPADDEPMRTPRVYDGLDEAGRPVVDRERLSPDERDRVLAYLEAAPVVLAARSYDTDAFAPDEPAAVPMNFRTDGSWVWPGAVVYYLRKHDVTPDPELLAHIRGRDFTMPAVDDPTRDLAVSVITGGPLP